MHGFSTTNKVLHSGEWWGNIPRPIAVGADQGSLWGRHALVFTGTYEHTIDAKNRMAIPAEIRALLPRENQKDSSQTYLYVTLGEGQALCLYTPEQFELRAEELDQSELDADQILQYERMMFSLANRVELDGQGRVRLPDSLIKMAGLGTEVVLLGVKDHLEIRDRVAWQAHVQQFLARQSQMLVNPRRLLRKPAGSGETGSSNPPTDR